MGELLLHTEINTGVNNVGKVDVICLQPCAIHLVTVCHISFSKCFLTLL